MDSIEKIFDFQQGVAPSPEASLVALGASLLTALVALALYSLTYGRHHTGAGIQRMFLLGGPSITALLLAIQVSTALALGVFGALAMVRFRTPIRDPAEMGFVLLLVAGAIGCATFNFWLVIALYVLAAVVLLGGVVARAYIHGPAPGYLIVGVDDPGAAAKESAVTALVAKRLVGASLDSVSDFGGKVSFHYRFTASRGFDWGQFRRDLDGVLAPASAQIHVS